MKEVYDFDDGTKVIKVIVDMEDLSITIKDETGRDIRVFRGFRYSDDIDSFLWFGDFEPLVCNEFATTTKAAFKLECDELGAGR